MGTIKPRLKQFIHSCFAPLFLVIIVFMLSIVLLFNTFFFRSVYTKMESNIYSLVERQENEQADSITDLLTQFANLAGKIVKDEKLSWKAFERDSVACVDTLSTYNLPFHKYSAMYIYYKQSKNLLSITGTCSFQVAFPGIADTDLENQLISISQPIILSLSMYGSEPDNASLVFAYPYQNRTVLFVIKHDTVWNMLNNSSVREGKEHFMLTNDQNVIYSDSLDNAEKYLTALKYLADGENICKVKIENQSYLLIKNHISDLIALYSFCPLAVQTQHLSQMMYLNFACVIFVIVTGCALLYILYMNGYQPIAKLANSAKQIMGTNQETTAKNELDALRQAFLQYGQLSREYENSAMMFSREQMKNMLILRVINGHYENGEGFDRVCEHVGLRFPFNSFCACVAMFDSIDADSVLQPIETSDFHAYFCQAADRKLAIGILNCTEGADYRQIGEQIMLGLQNSESDPPTIAIGHPMNDIQNIPVSYNEARSALDYRLVFGLHTVILYDQLMMTDMNSAEYPRKHLNAIMNSLDNWDPDTLPLLLEELVQTIREQHLSLQQTKSVCIELSSAFMRVLHHFNSKHLSDSEPFDIFRICEYNSIDELVYQISEMTRSMQHVLQQRDTLCRDREIRRCLNMMEENIGNEQFSLEQLCDEFDITPQTLRRRFKNATGKTMNDYMIGLRMDMAKQLLSETELDIADVAHQCGYTDQSSFIRVFKGKEGTTPGQYREKRFFTES